jgi:hypothetical protein
VHGRSTPLQGVATRRIFQAILLGLSGFTFYRTGMEYQIIPKAGRFVATLLRVTSLEAHGCTKPSPCSAIYIGILHDGCRIFPTAGTAGAGSSITASFSKTEVGNGYFLAAPPGVTLARWIVEASVDNGTSWALAGASVWRLNQQNTAGIMEFYPSLVSDLRQSPSGELWVDYRPQWQWIVSAVVVNLNNGVLLVVAAVAGFSGRVHILKRALIVMFSWAVVQDCAAACSYLASGQIREAISRVLVIPENSIFAAIMLWRERRVLEGILLYGVIGITARCLMDLVNYRADLVLFLSGNLLTTCFTSTVFALVCLFLRRRDLRRARALVIPDRLGYEVLWAAVTVEPNATSDVERLRFIAAKVWGPFPMVGNSRFGREQLLLC